MIQDGGQEGPKEKRVTFLALMSKRFEASSITKSKYFYPLKPKILL